MINEIRQIQHEADLLYPSQQVDKAVEKMGREITGVLSDKDPVVLCLMIGGLVTTGKLLPLLEFPLQLEYVHATRYRGKTRGASIVWYRKPERALENRSVLIVDDILDQGITLAAVIEACQHHQAKEIYTAVLVDKQVHEKKALQHADFTGLLVPDRYVFGYGMDYKGYLRNATGIYAVKES